MTEKTRPLFSFGIVADPQYANADPRPEMGRYYAESPRKLAQAIGAFNGEELAFVVTLGDIIDHGFENFDAILSVYGQLRHRSVMLPGNHDFSVAPEHLSAVHSRLGMPAPWHDFAIGGMRFVVLDGNEVSLFAPPPGDPRRLVAQQRLQYLRDMGAVNAQEWNASLGDGQFEWLRTVLQEADADGEKVVIFCHYPICPENAHNMWDAPRILDLLAEHPSVVAWFNGHNHDGNYAMRGGAHFVNFKGMVDTPDQNTFAIADVFADRIVIRGFGREEDRLLAL